MQEMKNRVTSAMLVVAMLALSSMAGAAEGDARVEGQLLGAEGGTLSGVTVTIPELNRSTLTDEVGRFALSGLPPGTHLLLFYAGDRSATHEVTLEAGQRMVLEKELPWKPGFTDEITVQSASRRTQRITEAPAAMSMIPSEEIGRRATQGQLPKLLEFATGVELSAAGVYDYNLNTRGFNSSINRRVLTVIDGRDPSVPFLGNQDWAAMPFQMEELQSIEMVRGPGSALYGADAFNGVLNIITQAPRDSLGGALKLTAGEMDTARSEFRWAHDLGDGWYTRLVGGFKLADDFAESRVDSVPYRPDLLPREVVPLDQKTEVAYGGIRVDKYFDFGDALSVEVAQTNLDGIVVTGDIGRLQNMTDVKRPWARVNYNSARFNVLAYYNERQAPDQTTLFSNQLTALDSENALIELQFNQPFAGGRGQFIGGASYGEEKIDSANNAGQQTLMFRPRDEDTQALFGQLEFDLTDSLRGVVAARLDDGSLIDQQFSPRGSLVWSVSPRHTLRFTYNEAFQTANYSEFFLQVEIDQALDLSALEQALQPLLGGVPLGFDRIPVLAVGNEDLDVEKIQGFEVGYRGTPGRRAYLTADVYHNELENFITELLPQVGTPLGRINPNFGPYTPPAALPPGAAGAVLNALGQALPPSVLALLSNNLDGSPILVPLSFTNFGRVTASGIDVGLDLTPTPSWQVGVSYSYFEFDIKEELSVDRIVPNAPENKAKLRLTYLGDGWDASAHYRWVDSFDWAAGVFVGPVPSFGVVDVGANFDVGKGFRVGFDVTNLFDNEHYELFGGALIGRRALGYVRYEW